MHTTNELLDRAKAQNGIASDYKLAQVLGVAKSAVMNYRAGRSHPDDRVVRRLAALTGNDAGELAAWMQVERARDDETRALWRGVAERLQRAGLAVVAAIVAALFTGSPDAWARAATGAEAQLLDERPVIDGSIHRRAWRRLRSLLLRVLTPAFSGFAAAA